MPAQPYWEARRQEAQLTQTTRQEHPMHREIMLIVAALFALTALTGCDGATETLASNCLSEPYQADYTPTGGELLSWNDGYSNRLHLVCPEMACRLSVFDEDGHPVWSEASNWSITELDDFEFTGDFTFSVRPGLAVHIYVGGDVDDFVKIDGGDYGRKRTFTVIHDLLE